MAYTIKILSGSRQASVSDKRTNVFIALMTRFKTSPFKATLACHGEDSIIVKPVRLRTAKPYCGQHFGECLVGGPKKKNLTYLEYADWIKFHRLVNATLNRMRVHADVWSTPADLLLSGKKMWIRKNLSARKKYSWTESHSPYGGQPIRIWNQGTAEEFS